MYNKNEEITVIIATFNAQLYLQKTFDSLRKQVNKNFELIIVDGNSKDSTLEIIKSNSDIITVYISEPDSGLYDAWNKGIKISHGEWICFLGAGDTLVPEAIEKYDGLLRQIDDKCDYISAKVNRVDDFNRFLSIMGKAWNWREFQKVMTVAHVGSLHNIKLFKEIGLFNVNYKICADYELLLRKRNYLKCVFLDYVIGNMLIGGTSFSFNGLKESAKAKYLTGGLSIISVLLTFIFQFILFHTYSFRHRKW
jgi:glycosyltransferase involved in cell wall biosynthesis